MKKKLIIILVVVLAGGGFAAKTFLLPKPAVAKLKVNGTIYVLPKAFTFNLTDGHYATMTAGLILAPGQTDGASATAAAPDASSAVGTLPEEAVIRDIITNDVTDKTSKALVTATGRAALKKEILSDIRHKTDDKVSDMLFTDVAVQ
jgi:flagellar basal body-associated protein FliL